MRDDDEAAARRMIREARVIGNEELAVGIERGLTDHRAWWDTDQYRQRQAEWERDRRERKPRRERE